MTEIRRTRSKAVRAAMRALGQKSVLRRTEIERIMFRANNRGSEWTPAGGYCKSSIDALLEKEVVARTEVPHGDSYTYVYSQGPAFREWVSVNS